jgi:hypothetical protein
VLDAEILAELEDLLRTMPPRATLRHTTEENFAWFGRARSIVAAWNGIADSTPCRARIPRDVGPVFHSMPGHRSTASRTG